MKSVNQNIIEKFNDLLGEEKVKVDEPMKRHTTFRIGGPADYFLLPSSEEELSGILKICKNEELPYFILGNGSNLLVSDEGYRGVIIQLYRNYGDITVKGNEIHATAGALLSQIAVAALLIPARPSAMDLPIRIQMYGTFFSAPKPQKPVFP